MIINKETQDKLKIIAGKMSKLDLGKVEDLQKELFTRYVEREINKLVQN